MGLPNEPKDCFYDIFLQAMILSLWLGISMGVLGIFHGDREEELQTCNISGQLGILTGSLCVMQAKSMAGAKFHSDLG